MVGSALVSHCQAAGDKVVAHDRQSLDITDPESVMSTLMEGRPEVVINCAAYTDVDGCELNPDRAQAANALGPENLAKASRLIDAGFITISSDYVFDGRKQDFYTQQDRPNPQSVYGRSKLEGEQRAQEAYARTIVVRGALIFGPRGKNFLSTVVDRARRGESLTAINDAFGTPTYTIHLVSRLRELAELKVPGVFHVVNSGPGVSFEGFARKALAQAGLGDTAVRSISMGSLNRPAPRPANSRLRCLLSEQLGLAPMPPLEQAIREFVGNDRLNPAK
jgi:dTDP-4-dehydrorhamnose reductase